MTKGGGGPLIVALGALGVIVLVALLWWVATGPGTPSEDEVARTDPTGDDGAEESSGDESPGDDDPFAFPEGGGGDDGAPFRPDSVAIHEDSVWVSDSACGLVVKIDRETEELVGILDLGGAASGVTVIDGSVWVGNRDRQRVLRIDPDELAVERTVNLPGFALGLASGGGEVWAADPINGAVYRIDPAGDRATLTQEVGQVAHHVAVDDGVVWVTNNGDGTVTRIETDRERTGAVIEVPVGTGPLHVETGAGSTWVTNNVDATVTRLDRAGDTLAVIEVGFAPHALIHAADAVWIGSDFAGLWRIDPVTDTASLVPVADFSSIDMAADGAEVWIADGTGGTVVHFDAVTEQIVSRIDVAETGDCETLRDNAVRPPVLETV